MSFYKFNLLLTSVLLIVIYFTVPFYDEWRTTKVASPNNSIFDQMQNLDTNYRMQYRFGSTYVLDKDIQRMLTTHKNAVLLLPTNDYMRANNIGTDLDMQEPAVFYYITGVTAVWASSPDVRRANWALWASKKAGMRLVEIKAQAEQDSLIKMYKPYAK